MILYLFIAVLFLNNLVRNTLIKVSLDRAGDDVTNFIPISLRSSGRESVRPTENRFQYVAAR